MCMETRVEENARLRRENAELKSANERLQLRVQELERRAEGLLRALEEAQRAGKRQAAPFSRHQPKADPAKPGRKASLDLGVAELLGAHIFGDEIAEEVGRASVLDCGDWAFRIRIGHSFDPLSH